MPRRVVVFSTDACSYCEHAKNLLRKRGIPFEDVDLGSDPELQAQLTEVTGMETYPQIIVDGEPLGGLNELRAAEKSGVMTSWTTAAG
jgi:glutaredoxin 3